MRYSRFAIYFVPDGAWGDFGAAWLGWDNRRGQPVAQPGVEGIENLTMRPRKYGFHATLKAPFRLADGVSPETLIAKTQSLATGLTACDLASLQVSQLGRFFALTAPKEAAALRLLAAEVARALDPFCAPLTEGEITRRRKSRLTTQQDALLLRWGYPYVMEEFRFHLTLTGPVKEPAERADQIRKAVALDEKPALRLDSLSLLGERPDGFFEEVVRAKI